MTIEKSCDRINCESCNRKFCNIDLFPSIIGETTKLLPVANTPCAYCIHVTCLGKDCDMAD